MLEITHSAAPAGLAAFRAALTAAGESITGASWDAFKNHDKNKSHRELMEYLYAMQHGCCAYCERRLQEGKSHVDHVEPRGNRETEHLTLTCSNLVLSCNNPQSCGSTKHNHRLPIQPRPGANVHFRLIGSSGKLRPARRDSAADAKFCIHNSLNLNHPLYCEERRQAVQGIMNNLRRLAELGMQDRAETYLRTAIRPGDSYAPTLARHFNLPLPGQLPEP